MNVTFTKVQGDWLEASFKDDEGRELQFTSYHPTQLDLIRADAAKHGADLAEHETMLAEWVAGYVPPPPQAPTFADFDAALTAHLDSTAQTKRYDNRITCALRAGYPGPFQAEGAAFALWMDQCNALAYTLLAEVQAGTRPLPSTTQALIDLLPAMVWPK